MSYNLEELEQGEFDSHTEHQIAPLNNKKVDWFDVRGINDTELIATLGANFGMHPLTLENTVDIHQRPKFEEYENGFFITLKALRFDADNDGVYDRMITMSYDSEADDSFSIVPSTDGFLITVVGEEIEYNLLKKDYEIEKKYVDLFDIMLSETK